MRYIFPNCLQPMTFALYLCCFSFVYLPCLCFSALVQFLLVLIDWLIPYKRIYTVTFTFLHSAYFCNVVVHDWIHGSGSVLVCYSTYHQVQLYFSSWTFLMYFKKVGHEFLVTMIGFLSWSNFFFSYSVKSNLYSTTDTHLNKCNVYYKHSNSCKRLISLAYTIMEIMNSLEKKKRLRFVSTIKFECLDDTVCRFVAGINLLK